MEGCNLQVSGHIFAKDGTKKLVLSGKWNSHLDMQKCDEEGDPMPGSEPVRMWTVCILPACLWACLGTPATDCPFGDSVCSTPDLQWCSLPNLSRTYPAHQYSLSSAIHAVCLDSGQRVNLIILVWLEDVIISFLRSSEACIMLDQPSKLLSSLGCAAVHAFLPTE